MIVRRKNVYGDGTIEYEEYEIEEDDTEATTEDYENALKEVGIIEEK